MGPVLNFAKNSASFTFSFLTKEVRGIQAAAYILAISSLMSSILALLRDRLLAHLFGAGPELDLYYAAFQIPDAVFIGIGALVSAYMLIPEIARRSSADQEKYIDSIVIGYSVLVAIVAFIAALATPKILDTFFPILMMQHAPALIQLSHILLFQAVLLGFSNIAAALTQYKHRYALYALSPIVYNLGIMFGAVVLYPLMGIGGLIWGVVIGAAAHLIIQVPSLVRDGLVRVPRAFHVRDFRDTVFLSLPRALALSMSQIATFGLLSLAGTLTPGSISVFRFAYNLQGVPLSIIGASFATAAFPTLAYAYARGESKEYLMHVAIAARQILFWSLPMIALMIVLRAHIVRAILGSGNFDWTDTRLTAALVALFAFSLAAQGLSLLLIRALYAAGKTTIPLLVSTFSAGLTILLGVYLLGALSDPENTMFIETLLRVQDLEGTNVLALALAFSSASIVSALILCVYFAAKFGRFFFEVGRSWWEALTAAFAAGLAAYGVLQVIGDLTLATTLGEIMLKASVAGFMGIFASGLTYFVLGNREFAENFAALRKRIWRDVEPVTSGEQGV